MNVEHETRTFDIKCCARCSAEHPRLTFRKFVLNPMYDSDGTWWTHWALCPVTHEPILQRFAIPADIAAQTTDDMYTAETRTRDLEMARELTERIVHYSTTGSYAESTLAQLAYDLGSCRALSAEVKRLIARVLDAPVVS